MAHKPAPFRAPSRALGAAVSSVQNPAYLAGLEARFAAAARHSRMVRILRIAVPAAVLAALGLIIGVSVFNPFHDWKIKLPVDMGNLVVSGTKITMESPHLAGFSTDQRPYEMWAKAAVQDLTDPDHVELKTLRAKVLMEDRSTVTMDARTGLFDNKQQLLDLRKDIFLQSSTGYEANLSQAFVDINKGTVTSDEHVDVKLLNGTLTADKLRIFNSGEVVRFEGNVVMNLDNLSSPNDAASQPADAVAPPEPAAPPPKTRSVTGKSSSTK
jgi:lipopolysaccharide export system protein LptC